MFNPTDDAQVNKAYSDFLSVGDVTITVNALQIPYHKSPPASHTYDLERACKQSREQCAKFCTPFIEQISGKWFKTPAVAFFIEGQYTPHPDDIQYFGVSKTRNVDGLYEIVSYSSRPSNGEPHYEWEAKSDTAIFQMLFCRVFYSREKKDDGSAVKKSLPLTEITYQQAQDAYRHCVDKFIMSIQDKTDSVLAM